MVLALDVDGLRKQYKDVQALDGVSLQVEEGEVFGFLGPNGAGKTTFTKCVTGFVRPDAGTVRIGGTDVLADPRRVAPYIGLVPDQYDFYANLTGRQHLDFYGRLHDMAEGERAARIGEVLEVVGMTDRADRRVKGYSHGMKQRICIAQAILHRPRLIFFDEPTNGLDPKGAYELRRLIRRLADDGATVFLNSHLLSEVEEVCDRVAIIDEGRIRQVARVDELQRAGADGQVQVDVTLQRTTKKAQAAAKRAGAIDVEAQDSGMQFTADENTVPDIVAAIVAAGGRVVSVTHTKRSLEAAFLETLEADA